MWEPWEGGYEVNRNPAHIEALLKEVKEAAYWVVFVSGAFRSGPTLLLHITAEELIFDYPRPWLSGLTSARVIYRDAGNIEHFFRVEILRESKEEKYLYTTKPKAIYRLERRMYYRIPTPPGSKASFKWKEKNIVGEIKDISAGGFALVKPNQPVAEREILTEGRLDLLLSATRKFGVIEIPKAEVVRVQKTPEGPLLGVKFHIDEKKREEIIRYVIQREIEMRKAKARE